jgi:RNA polymerase sporulation-specific sigma factor
MDSVKEFQGEDALLSEEETAGLIRRVHNGDQDAKALLIERNLRLVRSIVSRFLGRGVEFDDLFQIGSLGLIKAIDRFNFDFEVKFSTYAVPVIIGEVKQYFRKSGSLKVSRGLKELSQQVMKARNEYINEKGEEPTLSELEQITNLSREEIATALEVSKPVFSLQEIIYEEDGNKITLEEQVGAGIEEKMVEGFALRQALEQLEPRLKAVIEERFFGEKTQAEIGAQIGVSQVQISRLEKAALCQLRELLREKDQS